MNPRCFENEMSTDMQMPATPASMPGCVCPPIYECPQERICERYIVHEVPHVMPINTKIVNHHIYRHTFTPCYTMSECDTCENIYDPCQKNF